MAEARHKDGGIMADYRMEKRARTVEYEAAICSRCNGEISQESVIANMPMGVALKCACSHWAAASYPRSGGFWLNTLERVGPREKGAI